MSKNKPDELNLQAVPFFARFLEGQSFENLSDTESEGISGGNQGLTKKEKKKGKKKDEVIDEPILINTMKFPSDSDEADSIPVMGTIGGNTM